MQVVRLNHISIIRVTFPVNKDVENTLLKMLALSAKKAKILKDLEQLVNLLWLWLYQHLQQK